MITTAVLLYLAATEGLQITAWLLFATVLVDLVAWGSVGGFNG